jgi:hypothetical protein
MSGNASPSALLPTWPTIGLATAPKPLSGYENDVSSYMRICASLLPKEVHVPIGPLDDLSDEELSALVQAARKAVAKATAN